MHTVLPTEWLKICKQCSSLYLKWVSCIFAGGYQTRSRAVLKPPTPGGEPCPTALWETRPCFTGPCLTFGWVVADDGRISCQRSDGVTVVGKFLFLCVFFAHLQYSYDFWYFQTIKNMKSEVLWQPTEPLLLDFHPFLISHEKLYEFYFNGLHSVVCID
jgi:hypothetical protein